MEFIFELLIMTVIFDSIVSRSSKLEEKHWVKTLHNIVDTPLAFIRAFLSPEMQDLDRLIFIGFFQFILLFI